MLLFIQSKKHLNGLQHIYLIKVYLKKIKLNAAFIDFHLLSSKEHEAQPNPISHLWNVMNKYISSKNSESLTFLSAII